MHFQHAPEVWRDFPTLVPAALVIDGITPDVAIDDRLTPFYATAAARLATTSEGALPEIQAWRRTFSAMGLKPTQYRCAAESLLRRFKKEGTLPTIHPLVDLCNAVSLAYAIPIAVFDTAHVTDFLEVRRATGTETHSTFTGTTEHPAPQEIIFADAANHAHARRWSHRQSAHSTIRPTTTTALIVAEALHPTARTDIEHLTDALATTWPRPPRSAILTESSPRFDF
ncbi:MAG TPA: phenylalanine--tRNA ligase beta subunit-related protein [Actinophytocola sp.]|uniref:B3/B4 domain-containing protein n=1 Tax=Actinophytocola sp. TaxID=1872138 RepID=UPI002DFB49EA|nr:phenylalanine--tRNA ligase beta subunit-related protein [Actinophytocola sp.]